MAKDMEYACGCEIMRNLEADGARTRSYLYGKCVEQVTGFEDNTEAAAVFSDAIRRMIRVSDIDQQDIDGVIYYDLAH